jgi:hypothetical protein
MKNIYTWADQLAKRTLTLGDLISAKGKKQSSYLNKTEFDNFLSQLD